MLAVLRALRNVTGHSSIMSLQRHTIPTEVMRLMTEHRALSEVQVHCLWILSQLVSGSVPPSPSFSPLRETHLKEHYVSSMAVEHALAAMETHRLDAGVQQAAAVLLGLLAKIAACRSVRLGP